VTLRRELAAAVAARVTAEVLAAVDPPALRRTAASGRVVPLAAGPAVALGLMAAAAAAEVRAAGHPAGGAEHLAARTAGRARAHADASLVAVAAAGAAGLLDDLAERRVAGREPDRGLRGHLRALGSGRVTTGLVKVVGIGLGALVAAGVLAGAAPDDPGVARGPVHRPARPGRGRRPGSAVRLLGDGVLVAGTANVVNLFDTRPGRAAKVTALAAAVALAATSRQAGVGRGPVGIGCATTACHATAAGGGRSSAAVAAAGARSPVPVSSRSLPFPGLVGVLLATVPGDLRGRWMLGDCGANALGAALGVAVAATGGPGLRAGWLVCVLALTAASERISFSTVIDRHRVLTALDRLGQR